jgi:hypothetical protein
VAGVRTPSRIDCLQDGLQCNEGIDLASDRLGVAQFSDGGDIFGPQQPNEVPLRRESRLWGPPQTRINTKGILEPLYNRRSGIQGPEIETCVPKTFQSDQTE